MQPVQRVADDIDCLVLAGGLGTRIRELFPDLPKPMIPVGGKPFLEWVLGFLAAEGVRSVRLSVGYLAHRIRSHFGDGRRFGLAIDYSEEAQPLGTGGAVQAGAEGLSRRRLLVLNADSIVLFDLAALRSFHERATADATIAAVNVPDASRYGRLDVAGDGRVRSFGEKAGAGPGLVNAGVYLIERDVLRKVSEAAPYSLERAVFPAWIRDGRRVLACASEAPFVDMGTPEGLAAACAFVEKHRSRFREHHAPGAEGR